jgi:predicted aspartyl protease
VPIFSDQFTGQTPNAAGGTDPIPPQVVLHHRGPCIQVTATVAATIAAQLNQQGIAVPAPVAGLALIDTGATHTCIDAAAAQQLRLPVVDVVTIASASHASSQQNVYPVHFEVVGMPIQMDSPRTIGAPLAAQGILALIGRDLPQFMTLFYNGPAGTITLSL